MPKNRIGMVIRAKARPAKKSIFGPHVHALHTCTHEETPSENGSVHPNVHTPVHASEGDADPLGERRPYGWRLQEDAKQWLSYLAVLASSELPVSAVLYALSEWLSPPPPRVQRWIELELNTPERFHDMPDEKRRRLLAWVQENVAPRRGKRVRDSYWLKHRAEEGLGYYDEKLGMRICDYVSNGELKGAMLEAGHRPVWDDHIYMGFCCAAKPGSPWGNELRKEAEARREEWKPQPGPEELLREAIEVVKHEFPELYDQPEEPEAS